MMIREYNNNDYDIVNKLLYDVFLINKAKNDKDDDHLELIAEIDNTVVGYILLSKLKDYVTNKTVCKIDYFCVDKKYRNKGIGKQLIHTAIDYIKEWDIEYIELTASRSRETARHIYEEEGFIIRDSNIFRRKKI